MKSTLLFTLALMAAPSFAATPAETAIRQATENIQKQPSHYQHYNDLAMAYARRARETSDARFYATAEEAVQKSFALAPDNFEGSKVETFLQLERHEFARALESATKLNKKTPDDVFVYGCLADANVELGNYDDAVTATQWMLNLRSANTGGLIRASYLRELHGNIAGALELMDMAYNGAPLSETEDRAWMLTQLSHLQLLAGDLAKAESYANSALHAFPDYHFALAALAQVRLAQGRYEDAVTLLAKRYEIAPHTENLYALAEAQALAGKSEDAQASYRKFEEQARAESDRADNSNHELIAYYAGHGDPAKALETARREMARRHDVFTLDAYAWALAANGKYAEAERALQPAMAMGVKDPNVLYHAGSIALHLHENDKAEALLKDAAARYSREAVSLLSEMRNEAPAEGR